MNEKNFQKSWIVLFVWVTSKAALSLTWPASGVEVGVVLGAPGVPWGCGGGHGEAPTPRWQWACSGTGRFPFLSWWGRDRRGPCRVWAQGPSPADLGFKIPAFLAECVSVGSVLGPLPFQLFLITLEDLPSVPLGSRTMCTWDVVGACPERPQLGPATNFPWSVRAPEQKSVLPSVFRLFCPVNYRVLINLCSR